MILIRIIPRSSKSIDHEQQLRPISMIFHGPRHLLQDPVQLARCGTCADCLRSPWILSWDGSGEKSLHRLRLWGPWRRRFEGPMWQGGRLQRPRLANRGGPGALRMRVKLGLGMGWPRRYRDVSTAQIGPRSCERRTKKYFEHTHTHTYIYIYIYMIIYIYICNYIYVILYIYVCVDCTYVYIYII